MIMTKDPETGYWIKSRSKVTIFTLRTHEPKDCEGQKLCDIHDRRGEGPEAKWPLNWRGDRGIMEVICPHGIGHPSPAQAQHMKRIGKEYENIHGCDGCCAGFES